MNMIPREVIADIKGGGDGCESSDALANWMLSSFSGKSDSSMAETVQQMAVDLLPLYRPDLFSRWESKVIPANNGSRNHEATGGELALNMLDVLFHSKTQAEACPAITSFLEQLANIRGAKARRGACAGAAVSLTDVLMLGIGAVIAKGAE